MSIFLSGFRDIGYISKKSSGHRIFGEYVNGIWDI